MGSAGSDHNMVNRARQILKERLQGSGIVGIEGRGALGAKFARRLFQALGIASGEDGAGALGARRAVSSPIPALPPIITTVWRSSSGSCRVRVVEAEAVMTPPVEPISSPVRFAAFRFNEVASYLSRSVRRGLCTSHSIACDWVISCSIRSYPHNIARHLHSMAGGH